MSTKTPKSVDFYNQLKDTERETIAIFKELANNFDTFYEMEANLKEAEEKIELIEKSSISDYLPVEYRTLRYASALETLIGNIKYIDIEKLEALAQNLPLLNHQVVLHED